MPTSKKKRKQGRKSVHSFTTAGTLPILFRTNAEDERTLKLMPHSDLAELREGNGTEDSFRCVSSRINWASALASMNNFSFDPAPVINAGVEAMESLGKRARQHGRYVLTGDELAAIGGALTLADDMHDATTRRQHRDALIKLMKYLPEKT